jgi:hypothetical protein
MSFPSYDRAISLPQVRIRMMLVGVKRSFAGPDLYASGDGPRLGRFWRKADRAQAA